MTKAPVHINAQPPAPEQESKSNREAELESTIVQWQEAYKVLQEKDLINSLGDDKVFRAELLSTLNRLTELFSNFLVKLEQAQG